MANANGIQILHEALSYWGEWGTLLIIIRVLWNLFIFTVILSFYTSFQYLFQCNLIYIYVNNKYVRILHRNNENNASRLNGNIFSFFFFLIWWVWWMSIVSIWRLEDLHVSNGNPSQNCLQWWWFLIEMNKFIAVTKATNK